MTTLKYRELEHTADMGMEAYGSTLEELFVHAAWGLFDLMVGISSISVREHHWIEVQGNDREELLVQWLQELIYWFEVKGLVFAEFEIEKIEPKHLLVKVGGEPLDTKRHRMGHSIKAVTYHNVRVSQEEEGWQARVLFDI